MQKKKKKESGLPFIVKYLRIQQYRSSKRLLLFYVRRYELNREQPKSIAISVHVLKAHERISLQKPRFYEFYK